MNSVKKIFGNSKVKLSFFNKIVNLPKEFFYRIISYLLSSYLFLNVLPTFMFIIYMKEKLIFSYDMFSSGIFGMSVFFFFGMLLIILFSILLTSSIFFAVALFIEIKCNCINRPTYCKLNLFTNNKEKDNLKLYIFLFISALLVNGISIYKMFNTNYEYIYFILSICSILTIHFSSVIFTKAKVIIGSLLFFFPLSIFILFTESAKTSEIIEYGLQLFNASNKKVEVKYINKDHIIANGKLLLLSPENIFILVEETNKTIIIRRDNIIIDIENKPTSPN